MVDEVSSAVVSSFHHTVGSGPIRMSYGIFEFRQHLDSLVITTKTSLSSAMLVCYTNLKLVIEASLGLSNQEV